MNHPFDGQCRASPIPPRSITMIPMIGAIQRARQIADAVDADAVDAAHDVAGLEAVIARHRHCGLTATIATPLAIRSICRSSAAAGERFSTFAPVSGLRPAMVGDFARRIFRRQRQGHSHIARRSCRMRHACLHAVARLVGGDAVVQRLHVVHLRAVHRQHHIAALHAGIGQRAAGIDVLDQHAAGPRQAQAGGDVAGDGLAAGADPGQLDAACRRLPRLPPRGAPDWREWRSRCRYCRRCANRWRC